MQKRRKNHRVLPGFGLSMGLTMAYLGIMVMLPLSALIVKGTRLSPPHFWALVSTERVISSFRLSIVCAGFAALANAILGFLVAWVLARYSFPGKRLADSLVDLPFAMPTAVAGIALTTLYSNNGWLGGLLNKAGVAVAYTPLGIVVALSFVGFPFVVRTVQPVLEDCEREVEEAASSLGARPWNIFTRVIFPKVRPALLTGAALSLARGLGEYGSVVFISGNMSFRTEIAPLIIMTRLEQFDYDGASAIAISFLAISFAFLFSINLFQWVGRRKQEIR